MRAKAIALPMIATWQDQIRSDFALLMDTLYGNQARTERTLVLCALAIAFSFILGAGTHSSMSVCVM